MSAAKLIVPPFARDTAASSCAWEATVKLVHTLSEIADTVPIAQDKQLEPPEEAWKVPAAQLKHAEDEDGEYAPPEQSVGVDKLIEGQKLPAGHAKHADAPIEAE